MNEGFFLEPAWAALTGTVTLISAIVPVVKAAARRIESGPASASRASARSQVDSKVGCVALIKFSALNTMIFLIYIFLMSSLLVLSVFMFDGLKSSYMKVLERQLSGFGEFLGIGAVNCCASFAWYILIGFCILYSSIVSIRRGFEFGIFAMVIGLNITIIPLAATMASTYWDFYAALSYGVTSAVTSLAIVIMTRLISKELYSG